MECLIWEYNVFSIVELDNLTSLESYVYKIKGYEWNTLVPIIKHSHKGPPSS